MSLHIALFFVKNIQIPIYKKFINSYLNKRNLILYVMYRNYMHLFSISKP